MWNFRRSVPDPAVLRGSLLTLGILSATGCAALIASLQPPPPQPITVTYRMPVIAPVAGATQQAQAKSGVTITATPVTYSEVSGTRDTPVEMGRGVSCRYVKPIWQVTPVRHVQITHTTTFGVEPDRLVFLVRVNNQLEHVFRGAGAIVQFNVAGKLISVEQSQYSELSNLILPPRGEQDLKIYGPLLSSIPENSTIGLFIYDVVTHTDAAGNATQRQSFDWTYSFHTDAVTRQGTSTTERRDEAIGPSVNKANCE